MEGRLWDRVAGELDGACACPRSGWHAKPILISGASAYRDGEFLYQGYVYDDHGAKELVDPTNPMISPGGDASGGDAFSEPDGTYTYPTGPGYDENAANLVELRVRPKSTKTAFRITLNTLEDPNLVATAIAIATMDFAADGTAAGHAYWVYDLTLREAGGTAPLGKIDVRSHGFGAGDPVPGETQYGAGALTGGTIPAIPYTSQGKRWGPAPSEPAADALAITASNVSAVTIDAKRAKVDCKARLNVTTDGPLTVTLADCRGPKSEPVSFSFG